VFASALANPRVLRPDVKARLREQCGAWLTLDGDLVLTSDVHRSRHRNLEEVRERLADAIRTALVRPKRRTATKPTRSSQKRRIEAKKKRGGVKSGRGRVRDEG
jgi:ribosome-associated protein